MTPDCPICASNRIAFLGKRSSFRSLNDYAMFVADVSPYDREIYQCLTCGFQFIFPMYTERELNGLYNQSLYDKFCDATYPFTDHETPEARRLLQIWKDKFLNAGVESWLKKTGDQPHRKYTFLDVGCGRGHNLLIFREMEFEVTGLDLSAVQIDHVRNRLGLEAIRISLEDFSPSRKFDCILAAHVIEHVTCPHAFVSRLKELLAPEGLLLIETPLTNDWGDEKHRYRDIYHTFFFDHFTLALLGGMHGLRLQNSTNVIWKHESHCMDFVLSFLADSSLPTPVLSHSQISHFRACHDSVAADYLSLARHYLNATSKRSLRSVLKSGWQYYKDHGIAQAMKRTLQFLHDQGMNRQKPEMGRSNK